MNRPHTSLAVLSLRCATALAVCLMVGGCSGTTFDGDVWSESALAVIGGAVNSTEGTGLLAKNESGQKRAFRFLKSLFLPLDAVADSTPDCPPVTSGTCIDQDPNIAGAETLQLYLNGCQFKTMNDTGIWHTYALLKFPNEASCQAAVAKGFTDGTVVASLVDATADFESRKKIVRTFGLGQNGDQNNYRIGSDGTAVAVFSDFPSGWKDEQDNKAISNSAQKIYTMGGMEISFPATGQRAIRIKGLHLVARLLNDVSVTTSPINWNRLYTKLGDPNNFTTPWDHSLNTYKKGDTYSVQADDGSTVTTTETADQDIVVTGTGANRQVVSGAVRIQFNISFSLARLTIKQPLVYSDPTCCYPTQGTTHADYDPTFHMHWNWEEISFTGVCGKATYTIHDPSAGTQTTNVTLNQCG